ncbi:hypothetical protein V2J09_001262 [Rumex salicifolius]
MVSKQKDETINILMFPWLDHGHISPFIELAKKLAARNFRVYLCSTPVNLEPIKNSKHPLPIELVELHFPSTRELPPHHHTTNGLPPHLMDTLIEAFHASAPHSFSRILETLKPDVVIYDFIQSWPPALASAYNIPAVHLQLVNASFISYLRHSHGGSEFPFPEIWMSDFEKSRVPQEGGSNNEHAMEAMRRSCKFILIKTFREVEGKYLDHLDSTFEGKRMIPVGPIVKDPEPPEQGDGFDFATWLDEKDPSSTVFVSFGSEFFLSKEELEEMAIGLELSLVGFIWVIRLPASTSTEQRETTCVRSLLPDGFVERVGKRGLVVQGWAPQATILAHTSIGGFVSHCGWGSVLESMKFGVPIVAMPMQFDQPINARLVASLDAGFEVRRDERGEYKRDEIARVIRRVVVEEDGKDLKRKAKDLSQVMLNKGEEDVDEVAKQLVQICNQYVMESKQRDTINILMFPWLAHGHISPFLELAKKLAARNFRVHLCSTPVNLKSIKNRELLPIELVELHLPSTPELPPHYHTTNGLPPHLMDALKQALHVSGPRGFTAILETLKPDLLIYDFIQSWAPALASSHNIPAVEFALTNASSTAFLIRLDAGDSGFPFPEIWMSDFEKTRVPAGASTKEHASEAMSRSHKIILIRTFAEIEGKYLDHLSSILGGKRMVPVGPLVKDPEHDQGENFDHLMTWLDEKEPLSTVFVSFGSEYYSPKEAMEEIATGLELSLVNFIWVIRHPETGEKQSSLQSLLPPGFVERIGKRGLVVEGWAPQAKILAHKSVGGFVSHCGWSSVLESMKLGVPIVAMPMQIDQPINSRLATSIGVGLEVRRDENGEFKRDEICRVIRKVVVEEDGINVRRKARELSEVMVKKGDEDVDLVAKELVQICNEYDLACVVLRCGCSMYYPPNTLRQQAQAQALQSWLRLCPQQLEEPEPEPELVQEPAQELKLAQKPQLQLSQ